MGGRNSPVTLRCFVHGPAALLALTVATFALPARSQVLVVSPDCGVAGQTFIQIKGSGWAEPSPPCEYVFYFDGAEVAPRQDDGLYGPPAGSFTVPSGTSTGKHVVKVELRISENQQLIQCRETDLCVVSQEKNPWANAMQVVGGNTMLIRFDPTDVCDITPCTSIVLVQSINLKGQLGTDPPAEIPFTNYRRPDLDLHRVGGITMDTYPGDRDPYYNGEVDRWDKKLGSDGYKSCEFSVESKMSDTPSVPDAGIPVNGRVIFEYEVNAFCAKGDDRGTWLGQVTWTWSRRRGQPPVITPGSMSRSGPSGGFSQALSSWGFTSPTTQSPRRGGRPCH